MQITGYSYAATGRYVLKLPATSYIFFGEFIQTSIKLC